MRTSQLYYQNYQNYQLKIQKMVRELKKRSRDRSLKDYDE